MGKRTGMIWKTSKRLGTRIHWRSLEQLIHELIISCYIKHPDIVRYMYVRSKPCACAGGNEKYIEILSLAVVWKIISPLKSYLSDLLSSLEMARCAYHLLLNQYTMHSMSQHPVLPCYPVTFGGHSFFFFLRVVSLEKWINSTHAKYFKVKPINRQTRVFTVLPTNWWRISMLQQWINRQQKQSSLIPQHPVDPFQQNSPNQEMKGHQTAMFYVICP